MNYKFTLVSLIVVAFLFHRLIQSIQARQRRAALATQWKCSTCIKLPLSDPLGLSNAREMLASIKKHQLHDLMRQHFKTVSKIARRSLHTFETTLAMQNMWISCDPENVQAILATQFKDSGLGSIRLGVLRPLYVSEILLSSLRRHWSCRFRLLLHFRLLYSFQLGRLLTVRLRRLGRGIFVTKGQQWEASRALMRPQFARDQANDLRSDHHHVQHLMEALSIDSDTGWTRQQDLMPIFFQLTLDSVTELLFGDAARAQGSIGQTLGANLDGVMEHVMEAASHGLLAITCNTV